MPATAEAEITKTCRVCTKTKPIDEFYCNKARADGHENRCGVCSNAYTQAYRAGKIDEYWEEYSPTGRMPERGSESTISYANRLWQTGRYKLHELAPILAEEYTTAQIDTMLCRAFAGGSLGRPPRVQE